MHLQAIVEANSDKTMPAKSRLNTLTTSHNTKNAKLEKMKEGIAKVTPLEPKPKIKRSDQKRNIVMTEVVEEESEEELEPSHSIRRTVKNDFSPPAEDDDDDDGGFFGDRVVRDRDAVDRLTSSLKQRSVAVVKKAVAMPVRRRENISLEDDDGHDLPELDQNMRIEVPIRGGSPVALNDSKIEKLRSRVESAQRREEARAKEKLQAKKAVSRDEDDKERKSL